MSRMATALLLAAGVLVAGHLPSERVVQMLWLWLPVPLVMMARPSRPLGLARWLAASWLLLFGVDACLRGYLFTRYGMTHESSALLLALANTQPGEAWEYLLGHAHELLPWLGLLSLAVLAAALALRAPAPQGPSRRRQRLVLALALFALLSVGFKGMRRFHPLWAWPGVALAVQQQQADWQRLGDQHRQWRLAARAAVPRPVTGAATVVLVLSDSVNPDNLQLHGYPRATTPALQQLRTTLEPPLAVVREAWAQDASTIPALQRLLVRDGQHLLALAEAGGYKVWWISNHDDLAVKNIHARLAEPRMHMLNRSPGRRSATPDAVVLPRLREALADPAPLKLIVLHLLGAHPYYERRLPPGSANPFAGSDDAVDAALRAAGRPAWLIDQRAAYDAALRHHDALLAETLALIARSSATRRAWLFTSDHGQEVGHERDHAGHSPDTLAGYRIPLLLWQSEPGSVPPAELEQRRFRADSFTPLMAALLRLDTPLATQPPHLLQPTFRWQLPEEIQRLQPKPRPSEP